MNWKFLSFENKQHENLIMLRIWNSLLMLTFKEPIFNNVLKTALSRSLVVAFSSWSNWKTLIWFRYWRHSLTIATFSSRLPPLRNWSVIFFRSEEICSGSSVPCSSSFSHAASSREAPRPEPPITTQGAPVLSEFLTVNRQLGESQQPSYKWLLTLFIPCNFFHIEIVSICKKKEITT